MSYYQPPPMPDAQSKPTDIPIDVLTRLGKIAVAVNLISILITIAILRENWETRPQKDVWIAIGVNLLLLSISYGLVMYYYISAIIVTNNDNIKKVYGDVYDYTKGEFRSLFYKISYYWGMFSLLLLIVTIFILWALAVSRR